MSKNKTKKKTAPIQQRPQVRELTPRLARQLEAIDELLDQGDTALAMRKLEELHHENPRQPDILNELVSVAATMDDKRTYLRYAQRLSALLPGDEDALINTAHGYLVNIYPALALKSYQTLLRRFPNYAEASEIRDKLADLEQRLHESYVVRNLPQANWLDIAIQQDTVRFNLEFGYLTEARNAANQLLRVMPNFVPALNNLSQIESMTDNLKAAITTAQRVLKIEPENFHATANLARFLLFNGQIEEARGYAERLKSIQTEDADFWIKQLETFSYLGDDVATLRIMEAALASKAREILASHATFWHYGAVAAMRLGDEEQARQWWERALEENSGFAFAQQNLDDLEKPSHERHAPWIYDLVHWSSHTEIEKLIRAMQITARNGRDLSPAEINRVLIHHPGFIQRLPLMLERGDPTTRDFVLRFAKLFPAPEIVAILRDYAFGLDGPDQSRMEAASLALQHGAISPDLHSLWIRGEWSEILLFGFEITEEPLDIFQHSDEVKKWYGDALDAIKEERYADAEVLLKLALAQEPNKHDLLNNLAAVYSRQGRKEESVAIIEEIYANHPDYLFGVTNMASILIQRGEIEKVAPLLLPLLQREIYHITEMRALCQTQINFQIAQKKYQAARAWLGLWKSFDDDNSQLEDWEKRITTGSLSLKLEAMLERMPKPRQKRKRK